MCQEDMQAHGVWSLRDVTSKPPTQVPNRDTDNVDKTLVEKAEKRQF